jgi:hypothetical protein
MNKKLQGWIALDQWLNATICGGWADETMSSHAWRLEAKGHRNGVYWRPKIDWLFVKFTRQDNHCHESYKSEILRRQLPVEFRP